MSSKVQLGDLIALKHGFAFKGEYFADEPTGDVLLTPGNVAIGGGFRSEKLKYYEGPVSPEFVLEPGDLLVTMTDLSRTGDTLGFPAIIPDSDGLRFLHNQRLGKVQITKPNQLRREYLYYLLCSHSYREWVLATATGTTVRHTSPGRISNFSFELPSLDAQDSVVTILQSFDRKLAVNRSLNVSLLSLANVIFRQYAVADTNELPPGWRIGTIADTAYQITTLVDPASLDPDTPYIALDDMPRSSIAIDSWGTARIATSTKTRFTKGDILFGKLRPYFKKVGVAPTDGVCSTDIIVIRSEPTASAFSLLHLCSDEMIDYASRGSSGTKMPRTSWKHLKDHPIALPPAPRLAEFEAAAAPLIDKIRSNVAEGRRLSDLRAALLPRLLDDQNLVERLQAAAA